MTNFFVQVYSIVQKIPKGKVSTYGDIAKALNTRDARKVGWALHGNRSPEVPCHRVVNKEGMVSDSFAFDGWEEQVRRLEREGVTFIGEKKVDLKKHLFAFTDGYPIKSKKAEN